MKRLAVLIAVVLAGSAAVLVGAARSSNSGGADGSAGAAGSGGTYLVRALFDNASFAVPGEQVRIAGAPVGSITAVTVTHQELAAVTFSIANRDFVPFHADATCEIRPQSLIAERYVDCNPGTSRTPPLSLIQHGDGAGSHLLPVTQTSSSIDPDIVQNISQQPIRQRLAIILDELGTGLAARGRDLNAVIRRADPALGYTDRVFRILAQQDHVLAALEHDSNAVLAPLAAARRQLADFVVQANTTATAGAARAAAIADGIHLLPSFLSELRPLMADLGQLADQGTPLMQSLGQTATSVNTEFQNVVPFAKAARTALVELGAAAQRSEGSLVAAVPLARRLEALGNASRPTGAKLEQLTQSLQRTGAITDLMDVLFYGTSAANGFDSSGHYVRTDALVGSCTAYARTTVPGCSANFAAAAASASAAAAPAATARASAEVTAIAREAVSRVPAAGTATLSGLLHYLVGGGG